MNQESFYDQLSKDIISNGTFIEDYLGVLSMDLSRHAIEPTLLANKRLLESAAIFACSDRDDFKILSLNIASKVLEHTSDELSKAAAEFVLIRLGNFPMLKMSVDEYKIHDYFNILDGEISNLPFALKAEAIIKASINQLIIENKTSYLTDFQSRVMMYLNQGKSISISAPTSAGKSFLLVNYIVGLLKTKDKILIIYVVPTRALISQVQRDIQLAINLHSLEDVELLTSSWQALDMLNKLSKVILILTPERLQTIEGRINGSLKADILILDEAHKIEDGARGIILEESIQSLFEWNPEIQAIFLSPFTKNPEKMCDVFNLNNVIPVATNISPVSQNIFLVNIEKSKVTILLQSNELNRVDKIMELDAGETLPENFRKKAWLAVRLLENGPTIVYCNSPNDCRRTADVICENMQVVNVSNEILGIVKFLTDYIHKDYYLIDYLRNGVGYHYGDMPPLIRIIIERLFSKSFIKAICCTSTLIEGMNFPAKNIIIYKPESGQRNPMKDITFWNLAGRAGRLMKDFCGNIYCIDIDQWGSSYTPQLEREGHMIESSMEGVVLNKKEAILDHLKLYAKSKRGNEDVEAAVTRFIFNEIQKGNEEFCSRLLKRESSISESSLKEIIAIVKEISSKIRMPAEIINKNRTIDPRLQNELYLMLRDSPVIPLPCHPMNSEFYDRLVKMLLVINKAFRRDYSEGYIKYISFLASRWVNENTLGEIIEGQISYIEKKSGFTADKKQINDAIDKIIRTISGVLQFEICRDISCYIDILDYALQEKGIKISLDNLGYFMEMGAYKITTLTLLNNGMPRTISIILSRKLPEDLSDIKECKGHIRNFRKDLEIMIPPIILENLPI